MLSYRHFLTHQFAIGFDRLCHDVVTDAPTYARLISSSRRLAEHFGDSTATADAEEELRLIVAANACLEECKRRLDDARAWTPELRGKHLILSRRFTLLIGLDRETRRQLSLFG